MSFAQASILTFLSSHSGISQRPQILFPQPGKTYASILTSTLGENSPRATPLANSPPLQTVPQRPNKRAELTVEVEGFCTNTREPNWPSKGWLWLPDQTLPISRSTHSWGGRFNSGGGIRKPTGGCRRPVAFSNSMLSAISMIY